MNYNKKEIDSSATDKPIVFIQLILKRNLY